MDPNFSSSVSGVEFRKGYMSGSQKTSVLFLTLLLGASFCSPLRADQAKHKNHKPAAKQEAPPPQAAPAPPTPPPPTPEQMPAVPAQVTYQNSQLTILARNSTLGDILRAVRKQTGATVDAPSNATQRVVGQFGPGPARDVLASVLDASDFNYVLLGSPSNPNSLTRVIVTTKSSAPAPSNGAVAQAPQPQTSDDSQDTTASDDSDQPPPSESFVPQDNQQTQDNQSSDDQNAQDQNQNPQKSPEQLLQELERQQMIQQQQMQQQQQQQNQGGDSSQQPNQMQQQQR
jgi:hypothetical protein